MRINPKIKNSGMLIGVIIFAIAIWILSTRNYIQTLQNATNTSLDEVKNTVELRVQTLPELIKIVNNSIAKPDIRLESELLEGFKTAIQAPNRAQWVPGMLQAADKLEQWKSQLKTDEKLRQNPAFTAWIAADSEYTAQILAVSRRYNANAALLNSTLEKPTVKWLADLFHFQTYALYPLPGEGKK